MPKISVFMTTETIYMSPPQDSIMITTVRWHNVENIKTKLRNLLKKLDGVRLKNVSKMVYFRGDEPFLIYTDEESKSLDLQVLLKWLHQSMKVCNGMDDMERHLLSSLIESSGIYGVRCLLSHPFFKTGEERELYLRNFLTYINTKNATIFLKMLK